MSGHSKFSNIKHRKAAQDSKRAKEFLSISKKIAISARNSNDPEKNPILKMLIKKARKLNMPQKIIQNSLKGKQKNIEFRIIYELYIENNYSMIIEAETDNKNRTNSEIKSFLNKRNIKLSPTNGVAFKYINCEIFTFFNLSKEFEENIIFTNFIIDFKVIKNLSIALIKKGEVNNFLLFLEKNKINYSNYENGYFPKTVFNDINGNKNNIEKILKFISEITENNDIVNYWINSFELIYLKYQEK